MCAFAQDSEHLAPKVFSNNLFQTHTLCRPEVCLFPHVFGFRHLPVALPPPGNLKYGPKLACSTASQEKIKEETGQTAMDADRALAELQQQGPSPSTSSDSQEEETALLPRYTKVSVVGNNRTKQSLIGKKGIVKKAVGLGGWHLLVSTFRRVQNLGILRPGAWEVAGDAVHGQLWSRGWAWELQAYCCVLRRGATGNCGARRKHPLSTAGLLCPPPLVNGQLVLPHYRIGAPDGRGGAVATKCARSAGASHGRGVGEFVDVSQWSPVPS